MDTLKIKAILVQIGFRVEYSKMLANAKQNATRKNLFFKQLNWYKTTNITALHDEAFLYILWFILLRYVTLTISIFSYNFCFRQLLKHVYKQCDRKTNQARTAIFKIIRDILA